MTRLRLITQTARSLGRFWHRFCFIRIDPFILRVYRIVLGLFLVMYYLMLAPCWLTYYGPGGISAEPVRLLTEFHFSDPSVLLHLSTNWGTWCFYILSLLCAIMLTLGRFGRFPLLWLWISNLSIKYGNPGVANAEEQVLAVLLFYSLFLPLSRGGPQRVWVWALKLLQVHFALIYFLSLPWKLITDFAWQDGTVIYYAVNSMLFSRWPGSGLFAWGDAFVSRAMTLLTLGLELLFPLLVWQRRFRVPLTAGLILLHLSIGIFLEGLMMFNLTMVVGLVLFLPSRRCRAYAKLFARFVRSRRYPSLA